MDIPEEVKKNSDKEKYIQMLEEKIQKQMEGGKMKFSIEYTEFLREEVCLILLQKNRAILKNAQGIANLSSIKNEEPLVTLFGKMYPILKQKLKKNSYTTGELETLGEILTRMHFTFTTTAIEETDKRIDYNILFSQYKAILESDTLYSV